MRSVLGKALMLGLAVAATSIAGCSSDAKPSSGSSTGALGDIGLQLQVGGTTINSVHYVIDNGAHHYEGDLAVADASHLLAVIGGIEAGANYVLTLSATGTNGIPCGGSSAPFTVIANSTVIVGIQLLCRPGADAGSVKIEGTVAECANIASVSAAVPDGNTIHISTSTVPSNPNPAVSYSWSCDVSGLSSTTSANPDFTCNNSGTADQQVNCVLTMNQGSPVIPACTKTFNLIIDCPPGTSGTTTTGGTGGTGGATGGTGGATGGTGGATGGTGGATGGTGGATGGTGGATGGTGGATGGTGGATGGTGGATGGTGGATGGTGGATGGTGGATGGTGGATGGTGGATGGTGGTTGGTGGTGGGTGFACDQDCQSCVNTNDPAFNDCTDISGNMSGGLADGVSNQALCTEALNCINTNHCATVDVIDCLCGTLTAGACTAEAPTSTNAALGPCFTALNRAMGTPTTGATAQWVVDRLGVTDIAGGLATWIGGTLETQACPSTCVPYTVDGTCTPQ